MFVQCIAFCVLRFKPTMMHNLLLYSICPSQHPFRQQTPHHTRQTCMIMESTSSHARTSPWFVCRGRCLSVEARRQSSQSFSYLSLLLLLRFRTYEWMNRWLVRLTFYLFIFTMMMRMMMMHYILQSCVYSFLNFQNHALLYSTTVLPAVWLWLCPIYSRFYESIMLNKFILI